MAESCSFCSYVFTDVHILCMDCHPKVPICIRCFSKGVESLTHKNDHRYTVKTTEFPLLCKTWTATEELKLLDALLECGIGNWSDIAKHVGTQTAKECEAHYLQHYIYAPTSELKGIAPEPSFEGYCQLAPVPYRVSEDPPRPVLCSQQQSEMAGYMAARGDFSHEFDNYAEMDMAELDFDQCEDDLDRELQLALVSIYRSRLRERARRKWLVRKHGLVHMTRNQLSWRRYSTTLGEATTALLGRFMQLLPPEDFDFLCEGLHSERLLRQQVHLLQESRRAGLTRLDSIPLFRQCNRWRAAHRPKYAAFTELLAHVKNEASTQVWLHKQLVKDASLSPSSSKGLLRRSAPPLTIEGLPGYDKLNSEEKELCANLRIVPEMYIHFKGLLVNEYQKLGSLRLANARAIIKIDVNKTRKLYDFLIAQGTVKKDIT